MLGNRIKKKASGQSVVLIKHFLLRLGKPPHTALSTFLFCFQSIISMNTSFFFSFISLIHLLYQLLLAVHIFMVQNCITNKAAREQLHSC